MPDQVLRHMNAWRTRSKRKEFGKKLEFLNRIKERCDFDNDDIKYDEGIAEEDPTHSNLPAEISGVDVGDEYMEPGRVIEEEVVG